MSNFYRKSYEDVIKEFNSDIDSGLNADEVMLRLKKHGPNKLLEVKPDSHFVIFLRQFKSPLIYLLVIASIVLLYLDDVVDALIIVFILLFNAFLGTLQEGKAQNAIEALKKLATSEAVVIRDGKEIVIEDKDLVPGDVIILQDGDKVPADARVIHTSNFKVSESALTGESEPVPKTNKTFDEEGLASSDQRNMVFKGTYVVSGNAKVIVVSTGLDTVVGGISAQLVTIDTDVPLKRKIKNLSKLIIALIFVTAVAVFNLGLIFGHDVNDMILVVIAIVVSSIPEGLPVVITLVLATGVWRMSKRNALVKRLQAVEALGQAKVIAVDKTGTITRNELMVGEIYINRRNVTVTGVGYEEEGEILIEGKEGYESGRDIVLQRLIEVAAITSDARVRYNPEDKTWHVSGDPTEAAMKVLAQKAGIFKDELEKNSPRIFEIPFDSGNKFHAVINRGEGGNTLSVVGAPEVVLSRSGYIFENDEIRPLNKEDRDKIEIMINEMSERGLRVLGVSFADGVGEAIEEDEITQTVFAGLVAMSDVKRRNVIESVRRVHEAGVRLVMITGDHKVTARAIARQVGIYSEGDRIILGSELDSMSCEELTEVLPDTTVFARVNPQHKLKIIEGYRSMGQIVAMTGDGVNDALSLVSADLGVAMGKIGTEVAKEASDIILLDDNFGSIISAMEEGRAIYRRIKRVILYLFSTSLGEVMTITAAILIGFPLPLLAAQIIWLNVVTDGILVAPLSMDPKEKNILKRHFSKPKKWVIDGMMAFRMIMMGSIMAVVTLFLFYHYLPPSYQIEGLVDEELMRKPWTISLTMLAVFQWYNVFNVRSDLSSVFSPKLFSNKWLLMAFVLAVLLQMAIVYVPFLQDIFRTTAISLFDWVIILSFGLTIVLAEEIRKMIMRGIIKRRT